MSKVQTEVRYDQIKREISLSQLSNYTEKLLGMALTLIDASVADPDQRKAMKQLVKQQSWEAYSRLAYWVSNYWLKKGDSAFPFGHQLDPVSEALT